MAASTVSMDDFAPAMRAAIESLRKDLRLSDPHRQRSPVLPHLTVFPTEMVDPVKRGEATVLSSQQPNGKMSKTLLIVLGCVGSGLVLLLLVILIFCCVRRRRRKRLRFDTSNEDLLGGFFSTQLGSKSSSSITSGKKDETNGNILDFILPQPPVKKKGHDRKKSVIGHLNPDIYEHSSVSLEGKSIGFSDGHGLGTVEFSVVLEKSTDNLIVAVLRACGLPARIIDQNRTTMRNPFVRVLLLPDDVFHQTKVRKNTLNPLFNECVVFKVDSLMIQQKRLRISVYDLDKKNVRHSLGHVSIPLESIDLEEEIFYRLYLERLEQVLHSHLGDMELSLTFIPDAGKMKVGVLNCKDFNEFSADMEHVAQCQVFTRVLMYRGHRLEKTRETRSVPLGSDIFFNEFFNFSVTMRHVDETHFVFICILRTGPKDPGLPVGRVELGPYQFARGEELMHWQQTLDNPRNTITMFHMIASPEEYPTTN